MCIYTHILHRVAYPFKCSRKYIYEIVGIKQNCPLPP